MKSRLFSEKALKAKFYIKKKKKSSHSKIKAEEEEKDLKQKTKGKTDKGVGTML